jgi:hypothetical protein
MGALLRLLGAAVVVVVLIAAFTHNSGTSRTENVLDTRTPGQYFKERQASTITPNGKIMTDTVAEKNGKIEFNTQDGKRWSVDATKRTDGTYQYGTPDEVK